MASGYNFSNLRPGFPVDPPAVARHLTFHLSRQENPNRVPDDEPRKKAWKILCNRLASHVNALRLAHGLSDDVSFVGPEEDPGGLLRCYCLHGSCLVPINRAGPTEDYRLRVRVDVHTELFSFTYLIDRIGQTGKGDLSEKFAELSDCTRPGGQSAAIDWLFNGIWKSEELRCANAIVGWLRRPGAVQGRQQPIGRLITDFRSVVVCTDPEFRLGPPRLEETAIAEAEALVHKPSLHGSLMTFAERNAALIRHIADPQAEPQTSAGGEAVVCGMLNGNALYAAALGQWGEGVERVQPIRHLLIYAGTSSAQLGRLLRRMHILGELRHAALIDYEPDPDLIAQDAGEDGDVRRGLRDASRAIAALSYDLTGETREITKSEVPIGRLQFFVTELANISQMVDGGLTYRVEQSRYYAEEFKATIKHLRVIPVSDWQAYGDFVERYIMQRFARIDRIGNRYEALGRRVDRLLFFAQAKLIEPYTKSVDSTVQQIREVTASLTHSFTQQAETLQNMNRSAIQQTAASRKQINLLEVAELFATVFLLYYVGSVIDHLFPHVAAAEGHGPSSQQIYRIGWAVLIGVPGLWLLSRIGRRLARRIVRREARRIRYFRLPSGRRRTVRRIGRGVRRSRPAN